MSDTAPAPELAEHYFRHEFGRLVAVLTRRFGVQRVELCEDAVQTALLRALQSWPVRGAPDDKSAWLYRVAYNCVLDGLRRQQRAVEHARELDEPAHEADEERVFLAHEVQDDQLRLLFVCSDPELPRDSQVVLALKTLCGFSSAEIALRFFQSEDAIHKRLQRARAVLRAKPVERQTPTLEQLALRLPAVEQMLYLLFTEGHNSSQPDTLIRQELCEEAIRLGLLVAEHPVGDTPETWALLALMLFGSARTPARLSGAGELLLLEDQDRSLWDHALIARGLACLQRSARGDAFSRYHAEAAIALEHCMAPSHRETRWQEIARLYELLERAAPSPLNALNRAIAIGEWRGAAAGLAILEALEPPDWLRDYYLWDAALGELYRRDGQLTRAADHLRRALERAPTRAEQTLLRKRLAACQPD